MQFPSNKAQVGHISITQANAGIAGAGQSVYGELPSSAFSPSPKPLSGIEDLETNAERLKFAAGRVGNFLGRFASLSLGVALAIPAAAAWGGTMLAAALLYIGATGVGVVGGAVAGAVGGAYGILKTMFEGNLKDNMQKYAKSGWDMGMNAPLLVWAATLGPIYLGIGAVLYSSEGFIKYAFSKGDLRSEFESLKSNMKASVAIMQDALNYHLEPFRGKQPEAE